MRIYCRYPIRTETEVQLHSRFFFEYAEAAIKPSEMWRPEASSYSTDILVLDCFHDPLPLCAKISNRIFYAEFTDPRRYNPP